MDSWLQEGKGWKTVIYIHVPLPVCVTINRSIDLIYVCSRGLDSVKKFSFETLIIVNTCLSFNNLHHGCKVHV